MRISFAIVISRGPPIQAAHAAARHWYCVDNQLFPLLAGAMSCLYASLFRASPRRITVAFPQASTLRAIRSNRGTFARHYTAGSNMADLFVELTAPNGHKYKQPRGLFINNEFVKSKSGETIASINPRSAPIHTEQNDRVTDSAVQ